jgi:hypothetical protein
MFRPAARCAHQYGEPHLPGFRVYAHQTCPRVTTGTVQWTEEQFLGLHGANSADLTGATNGLYFVQNDVVDFC